jgi:hypothetical protein
MHTMQHREALALARRYDVEPTRVYNLLTAGWSLEAVEARLAAMPTWRS